MRYARHVDDDAALTVPEHSVDVVHCIHLKLVAHLRVRHKITAFVFH